MTAAGKKGLDASILVSAIEDATAKVQTKLENIKGQGDSISIAEMFELQLLMNHLSQLSEASTSVVMAMNSTIKTMAANAGR